MTRSASQKKTPGSDLLPSHGGAVCRWIEGNLVHSSGDYYGKPFRLTKEQKRLVWRIYEYRPGSESAEYPHGRRVVRQVLYGRPKGYGKTELAAALALAELAGPVAPLSPDIPVAAASFDQADLLFGAARVMVEEGPLKPYFEVYDTEILLKDKPGTLYRVAAAAGTNDGLRPTTRFADETHEWKLKHRVHVVLTNGLAKRRNSLAFDLSTAGDDDEAPPLGPLYHKGKMIETGELNDPSFLFDWLEHPDPECELDTEEQVRAAVALAYAEAGAHVDQEQIVSRFYEIPEFEFRRYYLNQFTPTSEVWLPTGSWAECEEPDVKVELGAQITLGFDGSYNNDSTALVGCTMGARPHLFLIQAWERPPGRRGEGWVVPRSEVKAAVAKAMEDYRVQAFAADPPGWITEIEEWERTYGESVVIRYETNRPSLMAPACSKFYTAVQRQGLSHDGNATLARHLRNARVREVGSDGAVITKENRNSPKKIDAAIAAVLAHDRATGQRPAAPFVLSASW